MYLVPERALGALDDVVGHAAALVQVLVAVRRLVVVRRAVRLRVEAGPPEKLTDPSK
jgi:hypothetical protein